MRALFLFLLAANLAFFSWTQQLTPRDLGRDPEPLARQIEPGKLTVVGPPGASGSSGARAVSDFGCLEWGSFSASEAARAEQALEPLALGSRQSQRRSDEAAHWWVFLPSQGSRKGALRKVDELKALGVEEYFVMQEEGRLRWSVSLGVFRTEEAAKARLDAMQAKKVLGARLGARDTRVARVSFQLRAPDDALRAKVTELAQGFPGSELRDCAAAN